MRSQVTGHPLHEFYVLDVDFVKFTAWHRKAPDLVDLAPCIRITFLLVDHPLVFSVGFTTERLRRIGGGMYMTTMPETGRKVKENFAIRAAGPYQATSSAIGSQGPVFNWRLTIDN